MKCRGVTLLEAIIVGALRLAGLAGMATFLVGSRRYARETEAYSFAQQETVNVVRRLSRELTNSVDRWVEFGPGYIFFLSADGDVPGLNFDPVQGRPLWRKWVCYYHDLANETIVRSEIPLNSPTADLALQPEPVPGLVDFETAPPEDQRPVARSIVNFAVSGGGLAVYDFTVTARYAAAVATDRQETKQVQVPLNSRVTLLNRGL